MSPLSVWRCSFVAARPPLAVAAVLARGGSARAFPAVCARVAQHSTKSKGYTSAYGTLAFFSCRALSPCSPPCPRPLRGSRPPVVFALRGAPCGLCPLRARCSLRSGARGVRFAPRWANRRFGALCYYGSFFSRGKGYTSGIPALAPLEKTAHILCNSAHPKEKKPLSIPPLNLSENYAKYLFILRN